MVSRFAITRPSDRPDVRRKSFTCAATVGALRDQLGGCPGRTSSAARPAGAGCCEYAVICAACVRLRGEHDPAVGQQRPASAAGARSPSRSARRRCRAARRSAGPASRNALSSSSTVVRSESRGTLVTSASRLDSRASGADGSDVRARGITEPSARYGPAADGGTRSTYCSPTADRFATTADADAGIGGAESSMSRITSMPSSDRRSVAHPADRDAAVGHLGVGEDAARVGELRGHPVAARPEQPVQPRVAAADVADPDHRDHREQRPAGSWWPATTSATTSQQRAEQARPARPPAGRPASAARAPAAPAGCPVPGGAEPPGSGTSGVLAFSRFSSSTDRSRSNFTSTLT